MDFPAFLTSCCILAASSPVLLSFVTDKDPNMVEMSHCNLPSCYVIAQQRPRSENSFTYPSDMLVFVSCPKSWNPSNVSEQLMSDG